MDRHELKNYNILEFYFDDSSKNKTNIGFNFEHEFEGSFYINDFKNLLSDLVKWVKDIDNSMYPAKLHLKDIENISKNKYTNYMLLVNRNKNKSKINIDVINDDDKTILFQVVLDKNIWLRKVKAAIYFELKYHNKKEDLFVQEVLNDKYLDTLKRENDGISTIKIEKVDREMSKYAILIDNKEIDNQRTIDILELIRNIEIVEKDEFYFYTCTCGVPECGGLWEPIFVYRSSGFIYWDMLYPYSGRFKFEEKQYIQEIIKLKNGKFN